MSIFDIFRRGGKQANVLMAHLSNKWELSRGRLQPTKFADQVKAYTSWVYAAANKNAISVAQVPLRLYVSKDANTTTKNYQTRRVPLKQLDFMSQSSTVSGYIAKAVETEEVLTHPLLGLLKSVNPHQNQFDLMEMLTVYQELTGNAYWYIINGPLGVPMEIWTLPAHEVTIVPDTSKYVARYIYKKDQPDETSFKPEEIIHFRYPNPRDTYYGVGPLMAAASAVDLNQFMLDHETALIQNKAIPDTIISPGKGGNISEPDIKRLEESFKAKYRGAKKAGKLAVMSSGVEVHQLSLTPKELNYLQGRKATREEIAAIFGVPMSKLTTEDVNRANAEAGDYSYMKDTVLPRLRRIEQKLNEQLLPRYDDRLFVAFDNPVPEDKEFRLLELETHLSTKYSSVNEERTKDGLEPVDWGEEPIMPVSPLGGFGGIGGGDSDDDSKIVHLMEKTVEATLKKKARRMNGCGEAL